MLFDAAELGADRRLTLRGRRLAHLRQVLKVAAGDQLRVGEIDGDCGVATVEAICDSQAQLSVSLQAPPPEPLPVVVVLALPRPKMLRRVLRGIAEVGIKELHLIHSYRVEKSYWQSPLLNPATLREYLIAGLEQARDTRLPRLLLHRRFRPFAEDRLPGLLEGRTGLLADPAASTPYPARPAPQTLLVIGPEGGFIQFETALFQDVGCKSVSLGPRCLRVETALHCALGRHLAAAGELL